MIPGAILFLVSRAASSTTTQCNTRTMQRSATRFLSGRLRNAIKIDVATHLTCRHSSTGRYSAPRDALADASMGRSGRGGTGHREQESPMTLRQQVLEEQQRKAYHMARMRFAGMGLLVTFAGLAAVLWNLDLDQLDKKAPTNPSTGQQLNSDESANETFQGKDIRVVGLGPNKRIVAQGAGLEVDLVETGTSSVPHFPRTIYLPKTGAMPPFSPDDTAKQEEYTLVGLGIRTVLFIQVYVVGMYVRTQDINAFQEKLIHSVNAKASTLVPLEKDELRRKLLDPVGSRDLWTRLLEVPGLKTAWRISPTRNTDFGHLRDGFVNGISARTQEARRLALGQETEFDSEDFGSAVQNLKSVFTGGKALKGSILILARGQHGDLGVLYQPKSNTDVQQVEYLGHVADERISRLIWLGYLAGDKVSSKAAREGVVDGCVAFAARPIGSVATRVI